MDKVDILPGPAASGCVCLRLRPPLRAVAVRVIVA